MMNKKKRAQFTQLNLSIWSIKTQVSTKTDSERSNKQNMIKRITIHFYASAQLPIKEEFTYSNKQISFKNHKESTAATTLI